MINLYQQASEYLNAGATNETIGLHSWFDDYIFLTKDQQLGGVIYCPGIDFEGKEPAELDALARRFEAALRTFTEDHRIYQYLIKTNAPVITGTVHPNEIVTQATTNRLNFFRAKADKLFKVDVFLIITIATRQKLAWLDRFKSAPFKTLMASLSTDKCFELAKSELNSARNGLYNALQNFIMPPTTYSKDSFSTSRTPFASFADSSTSTPTTSVMPGSPKTISSITTPVPPPSKRGGATCSMMTTG
jgi:type IV secretory pathway VirB4 component